MLEGERTYATTGEIMPPPPKVDPRRDEMIMGRMALPAEPRPTMGLVFVPPAPEHPAPAAKPRLKGRGAR